MDPSAALNFDDLPDIVPDLMPLFPVEALPLEALPVTAALWFTRLLVFFSRHALILAFLGALIENTILLGFLLPGGTVVALSAAGGRASGMSLPLLIFVSGVGMTCGAVVDYYLGKAGVHQLLHRKWAGKWGKKLARQLNNAEPLLRRHGWWVMLFAHAFGHGRSSLALAAGASNFPLKRFLIIEIPAAMLWSALYAGGGYLLAAQWQSLEFTLRRMGWIGAAFVIVGAIGYWFWNKHQGKDDPEQDEGGPALAPVADMPSTTVVTAVSNTDGANGAPGTVTPAAPADPSAVPTKSGTETEKEPAEWQR